MTASCWPWSWMIMRLPSGAAVIVYFTSRLQSTGESAEAASRERYYAPGKAARPPPRTTFNVLAWIRYIEPMTNEGRGGHSKTRKCAKSVPEGLVGQRGFEPPLREEHAPKACRSASSAIGPLPYHK